MNPEEIRDTYLKPRKPDALTAKELFMKGRHYTEGGKMLRKRGFSGYAVDLYKKARRYEEAIECAIEASNLEEAANLYSKIKKQRQGAKRILSLKPPDKSRLVEEKFFNSREAIGIRAIRNASLIRTFNEQKARMAARLYSEIGAHLEGYHAITEQQPDIAFNLLVSHENLQEAEEALKQHEENPIKLARLIKKLHNSRVS